MGVEQNQHERTTLRVELSDYLIGRLNEPWMIGILIVTQELDPDDVNLARSDEIEIGQELTHRPDAFETEVAAIARDDCCELERVSEDAMSAVRWASKVDDDCGVLELVRALPNEVVQEQIHYWNASKTAVAASSRPKHKLGVGSYPTVAHRHAVANRFQHFCETLGPPRRPIATWYNDKVYGREYYFGRCTDKCQRARRKDCRNETNSQE